MRIYLFIVLPFLHARLDYHIPVNGTVFLNTNISYASNVTYLNQFAGSLLVAVNDDASETEGVVSVTMHTTSEQLTNSTYVCMMETGSGGGLYIFVRRSTSHLLRTETDRVLQTPQVLNLTDAFTFNITLLLPQSDSSPRNIHELMCHLPHFQHTYAQLDPQITFDNVVFGGAMAGVYVEVPLPNLSVPAPTLISASPQSVKASTAVVKASTAEIRGSFKVSSQLSLETVSASVSPPVAAEKHSEHLSGPSMWTYTCTTMEHLGSQHTCFLTLATGMPYRPIMSV